jgi:predicted nucleotidyltransferase
MFMLICVGYVDDSLVDSWIVMYVGLKWLVAGQGVVPVSFDELVDAMVVEDRQLRRAINSLLAEKLTGTIQIGAWHSVIDAFLAESMFQLDALKMPTSSFIDEDKGMIDRAFYEMVIRSADLF